jgi:hypothetical protein
MFGVVVVPVTITVAAKAAPAFLVVQNSQAGLITRMLTTVKITTKHQVLADQAYIQAIREAVMVPQVL